MTAGILDCPTEDAEQEQLFLWARYEEHAIPELRWMFAVPNGGLRNKVTAARMKSTGTRPGVPDIFLPAAKGKYHGLFIEMKRQHGGVLSPDQKIWLNALTRNGYYAIRCNGFEEARQEILKYLGRMPADPKEDGKRQRSRSSRRWRNEEKNSALLSSRLTKEGITHQAPGNR